MRIHAINLDADTARWERFQRLNGTAADIIRFPAVDGATVDRAALSANAFIAEPLSRTDAALGRTCSHIALWYQAVDTHTTLTIVEDDAVLAANFASAARRILDRLNGDRLSGGWDDSGWDDRGWDIVVWGWDFGVAAWAEIPAGVTVCRLEFDQAEMARNVDGFRFGDPPRTAVRLRHCRGPVAYTVTPSGARALLDAALPITDRTVEFSCGAEVVANATHDVDMNRVFPELRTYACMPPMALASGG